MLLFLAAFTGVYLEITKHGGFGMLLYYTVLSNLLVTIFTGYLLRVMSRSGENWQSPTLLRLKGWRYHEYHDYLCDLPFYACSDRDRLLPCGKFPLPLYRSTLVLADTLFFDKRGQYKIWDPVLWTILPLVYMIFALFNGLVLKLNIPNSKDNPFPYFFLNVNKGLGRGYQMVFDHFLRRIWLQDLSST